jgi:hypothetical protein
MSYIEKNKHIIKESFVDVSKFNTTFANGKITADKKLVNKILEQVTHKSGYAVCHGLNKVLAKHGMDIHKAEDAEIARQFLEDTFRELTTLIDLKQYSPVGNTYSHVAKMDVDGYNKNKNFSPNAEHTEAREFVTTKTVHFDSATPFIGNVYGPTKNISGGHPIICDTRQFCKDRGVDPMDLVENIPNNYNVAVKTKYYQDILDNYSFGLKIDQANDVFMIVLYNEVKGGLAHAATRPAKIDENKPAARPIRHVEYQCKDADHLKIWYDYYHLSLDKAKDHNEKEVPLGLYEYHKAQKAKPYDHFVEVK